MRLNPYHPERFWSHLGRAYFVASRYEQAIEAFRHDNSPDAGLYSFLAAAYAELGDDERAARNKTTLLEKSPKFSIEAFLSTMHYTRDEDRERHRQSLIKAGLPA